MIQKVNNLNNINKSNFKHPNPNKNQKANIILTNKNYYPSDFIDDYWFDKLNYFA